jgi:hypothetical protein
MNLNGVCRFKDEHLAQQFDFGQEVADEDSDSIGADFDLPAPKAKKRKFQPPLSAESTMPFFAMSPMNYDFLQARNFDLVAFSFEFGQPLPLVPDVDWFKFRPPPVEKVIIKNAQYATKSNLPTTDPE